MSELNIRIRKLQDNGSTFRATPETLYMGGVGSARVDTLRFEVPEEWNGCAISLHVKRLNGALPDPQLLDENHCVIVDKRWTKEKQGSWMLLAMNDAGYIAMTKPGQYTCYETIDLNSTTETIPQSLYEQFVAAVLNYANQALASRNAAGEKAEEAKGHADRAGAYEEKTQKEMDQAGQYAEAAKQQANAAAGSADLASQKAEQAGAAKEEAERLQREILSVTTVLPFPLTTADGTTLTTADGEALDTGVRQVRGAKEAEEAAQQAKAARTEAEQAAAATQAERQAAGEKAEEAKGHADRAAESEKKTRQEMDKAGQYAEAAKQQANAAAGSADLASQKAEQAGAAKEEAERLQREILSVTTVLPFPLTTADGTTLTTADGEALDTGVRQVRGAKEAEEAAQQAKAARTEAEQAAAATQAERQAAERSAARAERATAHAESLLYMNEVLLRLTELAADPLITADGDALETAGGIPLEASVRAIRTAKTLDEAEYLPVSLGLLKQCLGGLTPTPTPGTTTATLGKDVVGQMVLGTT